MCEVCVSCLYVNVCVNVCESMFINMHDGHAMCAWVVVEARECVWYVCDCV